jgi:hypothetical protein
MAADRKWSDYIREIPAVTWLFVIFALVALAGGFTAMAFLNVEPAAITAFVTAVFGVIGTHLGHVSGNQQATKNGSGESSSKDGSDQAPSHS